MPRYNSLFIDCLAGTTRKIAQATLSLREFPHPCNEQRNTSTMRVSAPTRVQMRVSAPTRVQMRVSAPTARHRKARGKHRTTGGASPLENVHNNNRALKERNNGR